MSTTQRLAHWLLRRARPHWIRNALSLALLDVETFAPPQVLEALPGRRVLVLAPHCDDESIGCGGTLAKLAGQGGTAHIVFLTDSSLGSRELRELSTNDPRRQDLRHEVSALREREAREAMKVLGIPACTFLGAPDGALSPHHPGLAERLAEEIRTFTPDLILLPFPTDRHRDHSATATCLLAGLERLGRDVPRGLLWAGYEVWSPGYPNVLVDISAQVATKSKAIRAYASQTAELDLEAGALALNRFRAVSGLLSEGHAEGFHLAPLPVLHRLCRWLAL